MALEEIGGYRLIEKLGSGGMGVVYLGLDAEDNPVAVKVLHPSIANDETSRKRLAREVRTLRRIKHPRIAAVLDAELESDAPFIVTDYVDGMTLSDDVKENGPFAEDELVHFGHGLLEALTAVHNAGVVHRDLKPANVMIMGGEPMVIDFGIAMAAGEDRVTVTGLVMGTPGYLSPEIVDGKPSSEKTDWWGWAATVAFAATCRNPYGTGSIEAVIVRVATGKANLEGCPEHFKPLLRACLDPNPDRRPSGPQILEALTEIEAGREPSLAGASAVVPVPAPGYGQTAAQPGGVPAQGVAAVGFGATPAAAPGTRRFDQVAPATASAAVTPHVIPGRQPGQPGMGSAQELMGSPRQMAPQPGMAQSYGGVPAGMGQHPGGGGHVPPEVIAAQRQARLNADLQRKAKARRWAAWPIFALTFFVAAMSPMLPVGMLLLSYAWQVITRTIGTVSRKNRIRELQTGPGSAGLGLASAPGALLAAVVTSALNMILPLIAAIAVAILVRLDVLALVPPSYSEEWSIWAAAAVYALVLWLGPGSGNLRLGSRVLVSQILGAGAAGYSITVGVCTVLALLAIMTVATGVGTSWFPILSNPFDLIPVSG